MIISRSVLLIMRYNSDKSCRENQNTYFNSIVNTNTCTLSLVKIYEKHLKNSYMFRSTTIIRELQCPGQSHYYLTKVVCILSVVVWQRIILFGSVCAWGASRVCVFLLVQWTKSSTALARTRVHVLVLTIEWSYYVHGTNAITYFKFNKYFSSKIVPFMR